MIADFPNPTIRDAVMKILSAIYESGLVDEVNVGHVLQIFGVELDPESPILSFNDPGWVQDYLRFQKMVPEDAKMEILHVGEGEDPAEVLKDYLTQMGIDSDLAESFEPVDRKKLH